MSSLMALRSAEASTASAGPGSAAAGGRDGKKEEGRQEKDLHGLSIDHLRTLLDEDRRQR